MAILNIQGSHAVYRISSTTKAIATISGDDVSVVQDSTVEL